MGRRVERAESVNRIAEGELSHRKLAALKVRATSSDVDIYGTAQQLRDQNPELGSLEVWELAFERHGLSEKYKDELEGST